MVNWSFTLVAGYNYFLLEQPTLVNRGNFILLTQSTGLVAVDQSGNVSYSDYYWNTNTSLWTKISTSNWRVYLVPITNWTTYQFSFNLTHYYSSVGVYNFSITALSSNAIFYIPYIVSNGKFKLKSSVGNRLMTIISNKTKIVYVLELKVIFLFILII